MELGRAVDNTRVLNTSYAMTATPVLALVTYFDNYSILSIWEIEIEFFFPLVFLVFFIGSI